MRFKTGAPSSSSSTTISAPSSSLGSGASSSTSSLTLPSWSKAGWAARLAEANLVKKTTTKKIDPTTDKTKTPKTNKKKRRAAKLDEQWEVRPVRPLAPGRLTYRKGLFAPGPPSDQDTSGPGGDGADL